MEDQKQSPNKPERKKLRVGQVFALGDPEQQPQKQKTQLKKNSVPYQQKIEKEKQEQANAYWDDLPSEPTPPKFKQPTLNPSLSDQYYLANPNHNLLNVDKFNTFMDEITFDEEEFKNDPEKYLQNLPEGCLQDFEDMYHDAHIAEIINDLDEDEEEKFEEKMKNCSCCHGFVYKCKGKICYNLGICQCMARTEMETQAAEHFIPECQDCTCCRGYVYTCLGKECQGKKACICFEPE